MVVEEDDQVANYIKTVNDKVLDKINEISRLVWEIDDKLDEQKEWEASRRENFEKKMDEYGLNKEKQLYIFEEFNILDMVREFSLCKKCSEGQQCIAHGLSKKHEMIERDFI